MNEKVLDADDSSEMSTRSLNMLVRAVLSDKNPEEVPVLVESLLSKVMEEFERRVANHNELMKTVPKGVTVTGGSKALAKISSGETKITREEPHTIQLKKVESSRENLIRDEESKKRILKQQVLFDQQQSDIQGLKQTLCTTKAGMHICK